MVHAVRFGLIYLTPLSLGVLDKVTIIDVKVNDMETSVMLFGGGWRCEKQAIYHVGVAKPLFSSDGHPEKIDCRDLQMIIGRSARIDQPGSKGLFDLNQQWTMSTTIFFAFL